jgi:ribose transport system substrate-binding protein
MRKFVTALCAGTVLGMVIPSAVAQEIPRPAKAEKPYRVGVLSPNMAIPHFVAQAYGFVNEAELLGMRVLLYDAGEHKNVHRQVHQMEDLIANRVDAIALVPGTTVTATAQIDTAVAAGIPVINVNIMSDNKKVLGRIRSDDYEMGRQQGEFTAEKLKGDGNVVMLSGPAGNSAMIFRAKGFRDAVAKYPGIKILSEHWTPVATDRAIKVVEDWNQTFPKIDAVFCGADRLAIGAAQAFRAQGRKPGDVIITTVDYNDDTERFIREGWISAAMAQTPVLMGRWGMRAALNAIRKQPVPDQVFTPTHVITKDNTDKVDIGTIRQPKGWRPPLL